MSGCGREVSRVVGRPPNSPVVVGRHSQMSGSGRDDFPDVRVWSGGLPGCPRVVGRPSRVVGRPSRISGSGRDASRVVEKPSRMSRSGWEVLPNVREWSGGPPK